MLSAAAICSIVGCISKSEEAAAAPPKPVAPPSVAEVDLKAYHPNEAGAVMILMYHRFESKMPSSDKQYNRTPDDFRKDLEDLYKRNYRPVTLTEYIENRMDVPAGKTPIVLTFDDSWESQFKIVTGQDGQAHIDPDCAVGIMETFHKAHADWPTKGTFFVLPEFTKGARHGNVPFYDASSVGDKFEYLLKNGYEIQNHSTSHPQFSKLDEAAIQTEIGNAVHSIQQINPKAAMNILALPYGKLPKKALRDRLLSGSGGGATYSNRAIVLAAYRPVASPATHLGKKTSVYQIAPFDPLRIERVKPAPEQASSPGTFEYWLKWFDENPTQRYVSDGNAAVCAVPAGLTSLVDSGSVKKQGKVLQLYKLGGGATGGGLSVEGASSASSSSSAGGSGGLSVESGGVATKP
jgi:peptidoglycan/xylan/chitin deacetylase (PgdA/CDA1 family)